jgi:nanoRNase/pAp phosphatase (c-di-AMP/oligoRNAs hydrolase)
MWDQSKSDQIKSLISTANSILIVVGDNPNYDQLISAASLNLALADLGKNVLLLSPNKISNKHDNIIGIDAFKHELGNQNLVIGLDYKPESVDKVSYHIGEESNKFYLTIKPKKGFPSLDSSNVEYFYSGAEADLVFLIAVHQYDSLDSLYYGFESLYEGASVVTIHKFEPEIGNVNIDVSDFTCMSEAMMVLMEEMKIKISADIATNIFMGIEQSSKCFSSMNVTADTFEIAADLLKLGARRKKMKTEEAVKEKQAEKSPQKGASKKRYPEKTQKKIEKITKSFQAKSGKSKQINQNSQSTIDPGGLHYKPSGALK